MSVHIQIALFLALLGLSVNAATTYEQNCQCSSLLNNNTICVEWHCNIKDTTTQCFSGDTLVELASGEMLPMSDLQIGQQVIAIDLTTGQRHVDTVYTFLHYEPDVLTSMLEICWADASASSASASFSSVVDRPSCLEVSAEHILFTRYQQAVMARDLKIGSELFVSDTPIGAPIVSITRVRTRGMFAPATYTGTVVANGIVASNYALTDRHHLAHTMLAPLRLFHTLTTGTEEIKSTNKAAVAAPQPPNGIHPYARVLATIFGALLEQSTTDDLMDYPPTSYESAEHLPWSVTADEWDAPRNDMTAASTSSSSQNSQKNKFRMVLFRQIFLVSP